MCCYPCLLESFPFVNFKKWKILLSVELFLNIGSVFYFILLKPALLRHRFSWVAQSCPTLCDPMNRSTPGLPVQHQLLEFTQTHVHRVGDGIQPSHLLPSPSPPALNLSQFKPQEQRHLQCECEEKQGPVFPQTVERVECIPHMTDEQRIALTPPKLATSVKDPGECNIRCIKADASLAFCGPPRTTNRSHSYWKLRRCCSRSQAPWLSSV